MGGDLPQHGRRPPIAWRRPPKTTGDDLPDLGRVTRQTRGGRGSSKQGVFVVLSRRELVPSMHRMPTDNTTPYYVRSGAAAPPPLPSAAAALGAKMRGALFCKQEPSNNFANAWRSFPFTTTAPTHHGSQATHVAMHAAAVRMQHPGLVQNLNVQQDPEPGNRTLPSCADGGGSGRAEHEEHLKSLPLSSAPKTPHQKVQIYARGHLVRKASRGHLGASCCARQFNPQACARTTMCQCRARRERTNSQVTKLQRFLGPVTACGAGQAAAGVYSREKLKVSVHESESPTARNRAQSRRSQLTGTLCALPRCKPGLEWVSARVNTGSEIQIPWCLPCALLWTYLLWLLAERARGATTPCAPPREMVAGASVARVPDCAALKKERRTFRVIHDACKAVNRCVSALRLGIGT